MKEVCGGKGGRVRPPRMNDSHQEITVTHEPEVRGPARPKEKRIIHFSSGETLEVEDSDEEEEEEESSPKKSPFRDPPEQTRFSFRKVAVLIGRISLLACDCLGERLAGAFGLNAAKYQYAIDQYHREHQRTSRGAAEGPTEEIRLSPGPAGGRYGATGSDGDKQEGRHNRGYREDEDYAK